MPSSLFFETAVLRLAQGRLNSVRCPDPGGFEFPVIHPVDIDRGAVCMECSRPFCPGDRYATRLIGVIGSTPLSEVVCLTCDQVAV
jgi:hypothetical protein